MEIKSRTQMHIIGLLVDVAMATTLTAPKKEFIKKTIAEFELDTSNELFDICTKKFSGIQSYYFRNSCTIEERKVALSYVNKMISSDPNCPLDPIGKVVLWGLERDFNL